MTSNDRFFRLFDVKVDQKETYVLEWAIMESRVFKILPVGKLLSWNFYLNFNEFSNCKRIKHYNSSNSLEFMEKFYDHLKCEKNKPRFIVIQRRKLSSCTKKMSVCLEVMLF